MASGMMDPHYFLGRAEILGWINDTLGLRLSKVEETCNGAVACQLLDALHPNTVPLKKVDFNALNEYDMINNYKVLQDCFNKLKVDKYVEVAKLVKGRPLDNMEFMQWFRAYWDSQVNGQEIEYDGVSRRQMCKTGDLKGSKVSSKAATPAKSSISSSSPTTIAPRSVVPVAKSSPAPRSDGAPDKQNRQLEDLKLKAEGFEKEKEFYYSKLRNIELLCQTPVICDMDIMKKVQEILYAATIEDGDAIMRETQVNFAGKEYAEE
eukprot:CAMPEP_0175063978 /NCGR_PEP_ID=MMETSP0052_2-20121109/15065_1 /TAXON_ID=51329 ORGANISM="Polytomella parva, Strain SAG 63-3" /NCGR_SAMPLE_ID=MMETSP0052_2 /ASSEMBLY_ACC=CAM_ASM_000194 /LENGTH=263 /DNA_ID=CAMNT_0016330253 /DNA_START=68 /DNA_END=859 /DNA_ORIENTATION=-